MKILITDDPCCARSTFRSIIFLTLQNNAMVAECESGEQAVVLAASECPDCVLMDLELGQMSGFEAIRQIRTGAGDARIIVVSSHATAPFRARAEALQVNGFVTKDNLSEIEPLLIYNPNPA